MPRRMPRMFRMPSPKFLSDMGMASIVAGVILLGLSHGVKKLR